MLGGGWGGATMAFQNPHGPKSCQQAQDTKPGELLSLPNPPKLLPLQFKPRSCRKTDCDLPGPKGEAKSLAEALTKSRGLFPQQRVVKMILPPITAESPRSNHAIQEMRYEMKHHEKLLGIF